MDKIRLIHNKDGFYLEVDGNEIKKVSSYEISATPAKITLKFEMQRPTGDGDIEIIHQADSLSLQKSQETEKREE